MDDIDPDQLVTVRGGILGLLSAAGPILNGVAGIIGAVKSKGGGGGGAPAMPAMPPPQAAGDPMAAAALAGQVSAPIAPSGSGEDLVSVVVSR